MTATTDARIGAGMQRLREHLGMTQARLAEEMAALGHPWHQQTVVKTEKGLRPVRLTEACDLSSVLQVDLLELAGLSETRPEHLAVRGHLTRCEEAERAAVSAQATVTAARAALRTATRAVDDLPADLRERVDAALADPAAPA
ncbi:helix-turn-helix domain-containing protein [Mobilicoccus massiliensis]|uniref:helix-turn-helix domain-containing protein n=1 Tax=Mobilicoccus massiliensis TaxID=1522310 RepID=UPI00058B6661|nr:helix-turn-helix transcriptional regulator [Mobilicoccus massiliensis]